MKTVIDENGRYELAHHVGVKPYTGCQCFKDCNCCFETTPYNFYTVKKKTGKVKTTEHLSLDEAKKRISQL